MNLQFLYDKLVFLNEKGIPLPLLRDNHTNEGSFTLTMFWIAFNISVITLAGKVSGFLGGVDFNNTLWLLGICGSFYLGRTVTGSGKNITISGDAKEESKQ